MKHLVTVTIPVYKDRPNASEIASYNQCLKVLGKYPITLFVPSGMSTANYDTSSPNVNVLEIPHRYLNTREAYSAFMLDQNFYKQFIDSEYILIYQLDAWVFRDELEYWCKQGYHYIGAPWSHINKDGNFTFGGVGNGGFSLRHVDKCIEVLDEASKCRVDLEYYEEKMRSITNNHNKELAISLINNDPQKESSIGSFTQAPKGKCLHAEDGYWAGAARALLTDFSIPPANVACRFSMEGEAPTLYKFNNNTLPFGCHAWQVRTSNFWKQFIPYDNGGNTLILSNNNIVIIFTKNGHDVAKSQVSELRKKYPSIKTRSIDMGDIYQIVTKDNKVISGNDAEVIIANMMSRKSI